MTSGDRYIDMDLLTRYFSGETSQEETRKVEEWMSGSEDNRKEFDQLKQAWDLMDKTHPRREINIDKEWKYLRNKIHASADQHHKVFHFRRVIQIAAAVILLVSIGLVSRQMILNKSVNTKMTETREISLPDGSKVTLNAGSKIIYAKNYALSNRQVKLTGEAYFEVKRDTTLPFIIILNDAEIEVLGTSFNVKAYKGSNKIEVTVTEGQVSLYEKDIRNKRIIATVGEKAIYDRNRKIVKKTLNADQNYMAWKTHKLIFNNDKLSTVAETVENVYHRKIVLKNEKLNSCTITTRFEGKDIETILKVLESTLDITIEQENGIIYLSGEGCE